MSIMTDIMDMLIIFIKLCLFWHFEVYQPAFLLKVWVIRVNLSEEKVKLSLSEWSLS